MDDSRGGSDSSLVSELAVDRTPGTSNSRSWRPRPLAALRSLGRPPRVIGLDIARGLAIVGMAGAHMASIPAVDWAEPSTWLGLVHGRSAILFALLAGISTAIITGREQRPEPTDLPQLRLRLLGRGAAIFLIGLVLELLNTAIAIILCVYGLLFVAAIPFLRWRPRRLVAGALTLALLGPIVLAALRVFALGPHGPGVSFVLFGNYPVPVWLAFLLAGLAIGRMRFTTTAAAAWMVIVGACLAAIGYACGAIATEVLATPPDIVDFPMAMGGDYGERLAAIDPARSIATAALAVGDHSGGIFEIVGSGGFVLAVLGLCLLVARPLRWVLLPIACLGMMPLTSYAAHVVMFWLAAGGPAGMITPSVGLWLGTSAGLVAAATVWTLLAGKGPLERWVARVARRCEGV